MSARYRDDRRSNSQLKPLVYFGLEIIISLILIHFISFFIGGIFLVACYLVMIYKPLIRYFKVRNRNKRKEYVYPKSKL